MAGATGTATVAFGSSADRASVTVTGQTGLVSGDHVEAWLMRDSTSDHSADEHELLSRDARVLTEVTASGSLAIVVAAESNWSGDFQVRWVWLSA